MDENAIKALLLRLATNMPGRPGEKVTDRRTVIDDDPTVDWQAVEAWVSEHGKLLEVPSVTSKSLPRGRGVEHVADHIAGNVRYLVAEAQL
jgi:hypothetical protein